MENSTKSIDWERVYWEQMPRLYNFFRYRICDDQLAEDLTATTFEKAWRFRDKYRDDLSAFSTWLFTIARNVAIDHLRKHKPEFSLELAYYLSDEDPPESIAQHQDDLAHLAKIVYCLNDREQELISLKYGAELSHQAIADLTGLSVSNVGVILHRAIQSIRMQWETIR